LSKTIIPEAQEDFSIPSAHRHTHLCGGLGLRDTEQIPLLEDGGIDAFLGREVLPFSEDAWYAP